MTLASIFSPHPEPRESASMVAGSMAGSPVGRHVRKYITSMLIAQVPEDAVQLALVAAPCESCHCRHAGMCSFYEGRHRA